MRWKSKTRRVKSKPIPSQGKEKWKIKFAIFPKRIINGEWIWFEWYRVLYRWTTRACETPRGNYFTNREMKIYNTGWFLIRREACKLDKIK